MGSLHLQSFGPAIYNQKAILCISPPTVCSASHTSSQMHLSQREYQIADLNLLKHVDLQDTALAVYVQAYLHTCNSWPFKFKHTPGCSSLHLLNVCQVLLAHSVSSRLVIWHAATSTKLLITPPQLCHTHEPILQHVIEICQHQTALLSLGPNPCHTESCLYSYPFSLKVGMRGPCAYV